MKKIGIIFGGKSTEHEISLLSAASIIDAIDKDKFEIVKIGINKKGEWFVYEGPTDKIKNGLWESSAKPLNIGDLKKIIDFAFPALHGSYGEDGTIQGLFEMLDIPYAGCGVLGSSLAMDKGTAKDIFEKYKLPICKHWVVFKEELDYYEDNVVETIERKLGYPVFVKPANMGSSVGISKAHNEKELRHAMKDAIRYDRKLVIEESVNCREIEIGVVGNFDLETSSVGEIVSSTEFYDYEAKYSDDGGTELVIPANLPQETVDEIRFFAKQAYQLLGLTGFARVDFFVEKETGEILINEINTIPGFTKFSMFPGMWKDAGVEYKDLIEKIVELGYERYNHKNQWEK